MTDDPLTQVENARAQHDMGVLAVRAFHGAQEEAETWREGFWATVALLTAVVAKPEEGE